MKKLANMKVICIWFMLFLLFFNIIICFNQVVGIQSTFQSTSIIRINTYTPFNPIQIYNDSAFESYGLPGDGSANTPYLIEGYEINITNDIGIHIVGTTRHFTIRNCFLNDSTNNDDNFGIIIYDVASGSCSIENNIIENAYTGIKVAHSPSTLIKKNTLYDSQYGIYIYKSDFTIITENNTTKCYNAGGVVISSGSDYLITKHTSILDNTGIWLSRVDSAIIRENNCTKSNLGINIYHSEHVTISDNDIIETNKLPERVPSPSLEIIWSQYISVLNNRILDNQDNYGVEVYKSNKTEFLYNKIDSCSLNGIDMRNSSEIFIGNNNITNNELEGIIVTDCYDLTIVANKISDNLMNGIKFVNTNTSTITYNNFSTNNMYGVYLDTNSTNNIFHHNNFINNAMTPNAYDDGSENLWYESSSNEGNYWFDYVGPGSYSIGGSAGSEDPYPLSSPSDLIIIQEYNQHQYSMFLLLFIFIIPTIRFVRKRKR